MVAVASLPVLGVRAERPSAEIGVNKSLRNEKPLFIALIKFSRHAVREAKMSNGMNASVGSPTPAHINLAPTQITYGPAAFQQWYQLLSPNDTPPHHLGITSYHYQTCPQIPRILGFMFYQSAQDFLFVDVRALPPSLNATVRYSPETVEAVLVGVNISKFCRVLQWILTSYDNTPDHTFLKGLVMRTIQHFQSRAIANAGAHKFARYEMAERLSEKHKGQKLVVPCG